MTMGCQDVGGAPVEFRQLKYFISAARLLSFTKAAEELFTSQSNISYQISNLENELGIRLFERSRGQVSLTDGGKVFLNRAEEILSMAEFAKSEARQMADGTAGKLRIGFIGPATQPELAKFLFTFRQKFDQVCLDLVEGNWDSLNMGLANGEFDVCFSMDFASRNAAGLVSKSLREYPVTLISRIGDPSVVDGKIDIDNIKDRPFVYIKDHSCEQDIIALGRNRGFTPKIEYRVDNLTSLLTLVTAGCGLAIMPGFAAAADNSGSLLFTPFEGEDAHVTIAALWRESNTNPALSLLMGELDRYRSGSHSLQPC